MMMSGASARSHLLESLAIMTQPAQQGDVSGTPAWLSRRAERPSGGLCASRRRAVFRAFAGAAAGRRRVHHRRPFRPSPETHAPSPCRAARAMAEVLHPIFRNRISMELQPGGLDLVVRLRGRAQDEKLASLARSKPCRIASTSIDWLRR